MKTCLRCHKEFEDKKHPNKSYCCRQCWKDAVRDTASITCKQCGKKFVPNTIGKTKCCSWKCRINYKNKFIACAECGKEFRVSAGVIRKFCSQTCSNRFNKKPDPSKKSIFICKWCGKKFEDWAYRQPKHCSSQCRSEYGASIRARQLYKPDSVKGRGINWKKQAHSARIRDNFTCRTCGRNGKKEHFKVSVHHIIPYRLFNGDYEKANELSNLVSLCPNCHPKVESGTISLN